MFSDLDINCTQAYNFYDTNVTTGSNQYESIIFLLRSERSYVYILYEQVSSFVAYICSKMLWTVFGVKNITF